MLSDSNPNQATNTIQQRAANSRLGKMLLQIHREGNMDQVVIVFQRIEKVNATYRNNSSHNDLDKLILLFYQIFRPLPSMLIRELENELKSNAVTRVLIDTLYFDKIALRDYNFLYTICWIPLLICLVGFFIKNYLLAVSFAFVTVIIFILKVWWSEYAINKVGFLRLYDEIDKAIQYQETQYTQFVTKICDAYDKIERKELDIEVQKRIDNLDANQKENYKRLELESQQNLQTLSAAVALTQTKDELKIKELREKSNLDYMAAELRIKDEAGMKERAHQIALAIIKKEEKVLSELAKALGDENEKNRDQYREIKRMQVILAGMKGDFQRNGKAGMADESVNQAAEEFVDRKYRSTK